MAPSRVKKTPNPDIRAIAEVGAAGQQGPDAGVGGANSMLSFVRVGEIVAYSTPRPPSSRVDSISTIRWKVSWVQMMK